jgi:cytochrome c556
MLKQIGALAALLIAISAAVAFAHEGAVGIAKERMDAMENMEDIAKGVARKISNNRNLASIADDAAKIRGSLEKVPTLFPEGSGTGVTMAKPEIWQQWDEFRARAVKATEESDKLAAMASGGDPKVIRIQFMALERACTACHNQFRAKEHRH